MKLREPIECDYATLLAWVEGGEESFRSWAGPKMAYPPRAETFMSDLEVEEKLPYSMATKSGEMMGFGQLMPRTTGRVHLIRLIVSPDHRGRGYGKLPKRGGKRRSKGKLDPCNRRVGLHRNVPTLFE